jgi:hypothetical protein
LKGHGEAVIGSRFRKRITFGGLARLNFSRSGVSVGLGPPGANINISRRGITKTVGLPGSGLSHQSFQAWDKSESTAPAETDGGGGGQSHIVRNIIVAGLILAGLYACLSDKPQTPSTAATSSPATTSTSAFPSVPPAMPNRSLTAAEIREAQTLLNEQGYNAGGVDGIAGPNTVAAAKSFEQKRGWPAVGTMDLQLLERLRVNRPGGAVSAGSAPKTVSDTSADASLAERVIREADHPCPVVLAARRLSDGSLRAACSNGEIYRIMSLGSRWLAMRCSAAQRLGVDGC